MLPWTQWERDVVEFMRLNVQGLPAYPMIPSAAIVDLRGRLLDEEIGETKIAMVAGDIVGVADGVVDSIYVLIGLAHAYGIEIEPIWRAVHASNMRKLGGPIVNGKVMKPAGWQPPDVIRLLRAQGWEG